MSDINEVYAIWNRRIRERCAQLNWTQQDLADEINLKFTNDRPVTQPMISSWTRIGKGRNTFPPYERMRQIASALGVDVAYLTGEITGDTHSEQYAMEHLGLGRSGIKGLRQAIEAKDTSGRKRRRLIFNVLFSTDNFATKFADNLESYIHSIRVFKYYYKCKSPLTARLIMLSMHLPLDMQQMKVLKEFDNCLSQTRSKMTPTLNSLLDDDGKRLLEMQETSDPESPSLRKVQRENLQYDIANSGMGEWIRAYMNRALQELAEDEEWSQGTSATPWDQLVKACDGEEGAWDFVIDLFKESGDTK